jgi:hypothetical protein
MSSLASTANAPYPHNERKHLQKNHRHIVVAYFGRAWGSYQSTNFDLGKATSIVLPVSVTKTTFSDDIAHGPSVKK